MKVIFAGTPEFAAAALESICASAHKVCAVLTQPDRPSGRGMKLLPSPVKKAAIAKGIPVMQPATLKDPAIRDMLRDIGADLLVVAAYGLILPRTVLDIPRLGAINIHASLLPRWRGAAPIQRAILAGDSETGICIMQMDAGLDTGAVLQERRIGILDSDTAGTLHDKLAALGASLVVETMNLLAAGGVSAVPQPVEGVTYAKKIEKREALIDWTLPAREVWRLIRAFDPSPGAATQWQGEAVKLFAARPVTGAGGQPGEVLSSNSTGVVIACGDGAIEVQQLQRAGGRRLPVVDVLRGSPLPCGTIFGRREGT